MEEGPSKMMSQLPLIMKVLITHRTEANVEDKYTKVSYKKKETHKGILLIIIYLLIFAIYFYKFIF